MNFTTYAVEGLYKMVATCVKGKSFNTKYDAKVFSAIARDLQNSNKFLVPSPEHLNVKVTDASLEYLRLPYPICAFEYSIGHAYEEGLNGLQGTSASTKRVALAYDLQGNSSFVSAMKDRGFIKADARGIAAVSVYQVDETKEWIPSAGFCVFDINTAAFNTSTKVYKKLSDKAEYSAKTLIDNTGANFVTQAYPLVASAIQAMASEDSAAAEHMRLVITNDVGEELAMAIRVTLLLNAKNLKAVKVADAPEKLNKKRLRTGKVPFFSYHTLDIFINDSPFRVVRKKMNAAAVEAFFANAQCRLQSVMGHFKVRATGIFWWSHHVRGAEKNGVIEKEYNVGETGMGDSPFSKVFEMSQSESRLRRPKPPVQIIEYDLNQRKPKFNKEPK